MANDNHEICAAIAADLNVNSDQMHCVVGGGAWEEFEHLENIDINEDFVGAVDPSGFQRCREGRTKTNLPHFHDPSRPLKGVEFSFAVFGVYDDDKFCDSRRRWTTPRTRWTASSTTTPSSPPTVAVAGAETWELTFLRHNARVEFIVDDVNGTSATVKDILSRPSAGGYIQGACGQECLSNLRVCV